MELALKLRRVGKLYALAVEIGVDESAISRWRKGGQIAMRNAVELSAALDVSLDWLITGRGDLDAHHGVRFSAAAALLDELTPAEAERVRRLLLRLADALAIRAES